jgi:AcrR family transcriptional regulator
MAELTETLARRVAERALAERQAGIEGEMRRIVDVTLGLIERTGNVIPSLREILAETGLSTQAFYRLFGSKDELLLVLLDDGRRQLVGYLTHRMARAPDPAGKLAAWVGGVLAQASSEAAAARTRPFVTNEERLAAAFPAEQQASVDLLTALLVDVVSDLGGVPGRVERDAVAIYDLSFGALRRHLVRGTRASRAEVDQLVGFCLGGVTAGAPDPAAPAQVRGRATKGRA